jgi:cytochrome c biogenesis protein CcmG, thiol:disulfide interchange protein DsbE
LKKLLNIYFPENMKNYFLFFLTVCSLSVFGQSIEKNYYAKSFINQKAPEFHVTKWLTEEPKRDGKFVLIDFWATWCNPCRKAIPELNAFSKKFNDDLIIIGVSNEKEETVKKMKNPVIEYYSALDSTRKMERTLEIRGIPNVILIDPDGYVRWQGFPLLEGYELTEDVIKGIIEKYKKK